MNVAELKIKLNDAGVSQHAYSMFGDGLGECYVLTTEGQRWLVYYSERGQRQGLRSFESESDACQHFFEKLVSDSTTRQRNMSTPIRLPDKFKDAIVVMPEYSYGVQRIVVTLDDGKQMWDVFVAGDNEIVKVGISTKVPFDPNRVVEVRCQ